MIPELPLRESCWRNKPPSTHHQAEDSKEPIMQMKLRKSHTFFVHKLQNKQHVLYQIIKEHKTAKENFHDVYDYITQISFSCNK